MSEISNKKILSSFYNIFHNLYILYHLSSSMLILYLLIKLEFNLDHLATLQLLIHYIIFIFVLVCTTNIIISPNYVFFLVDILFSYYLMLMYSLILLTNLYLFSFLYFFVLIFEYIYIYTQSF